MRKHRSCESLTYRVPRRIALIGAACRVPRERWPAPRGSAVEVARAEVGTVAEDLDLVGVEHRPVRKRLGAGVAPRQVGVLGLQGDLDLGGAGAAFTPLLPLSVISRALCPRSPGHSVSL